MSELETKDTAAGEGSGAEKKTSKAGNPEMVTIPINGRDVAVPFTKAVELAARAMTIDQERGRLDARERALKGEETEYEAFKQFRSAMQANPKLRKAVTAATEDPDGFLESTQRRNGHSRDEDDRDGDDYRRDSDSDPDEERPRRKRGQRASAGDAELRAEIEGLKREMAESRAETRRERIHRNQTAIEKQVSSAVGGYPWLKGKTKSLAEKQVILELAASGGQRSVDEVAASVANEFKTLRDEEGQRELETHEERRALRTANPADGIPELTPSKKMTAEDLRNGTIATEARKAFKKAFGIRYK